MMGLGRKEWTGIAGVGLVLLALAGVTWYASYHGGRKLKVMTLICESTGEVFEVAVDPEDDDFYENYRGASGAVAVPCKICGGKDAYLAERGPDGYWVRRAESP